LAARPQVWPYFSESSGQRGFTSKAYFSACSRPGLQAHGGGHGDHGAVVGAQVQLGVVHADLALGAGGIQLGAQQLVGAHAGHHHAAHAGVLQRRQRLA
jgi:hypothetical protein